MKNKIFNKRKPILLKLAHSDEMTIQSSDIIGPLKTMPFVKKFEGNPIFSAEKVPFPSSLAFNAGVLKFESQYIMAFRNDVCLPYDMQRVQHVETGVAFSNDGISWKVKDSPVNLWYRGQRLPWCNDARLTELEGKLFMTFVLSGFYGQRPGIAVSKNFQDFEVIYLGVPNQRNMVLFPDKINGFYWRLERPNILRDGTKNDIWISSSPDLKYWGNPELLLAVEDVEFCNDKLGAGPPPIKTECGWLLIFHAVDSDPARTIKYSSGAIWNKRYTAGAVLLDAHDPETVVGLLRAPLFVPDQPYETGNPSKFYRENVVFPGGYTLEKDNILRIYYGAGDLCECFAEMNLNTLLESIEPYKRKTKTATVLHV